MIPDEVEVGSTRKVQLDQYEPVTSLTNEVHTVPDDIETREEYEEWLERLQDEVMKVTEQAAMRRHEEYVREEAFGDD